MELGTDMNHKMQLSVIGGSDEIHRDLPTSKLQLFELVGSWLNCMIYVSYWVTFIDTQALHTHTHTSVFSGLSSLEFISWYSMLLL